VLACCVVKGLSCDCTTRLIIASFLRTVTPADVCTLHLAAGVMTCLHVRLWQASLPPEALSARAVRSSVRPFVRSSVRCYQTCERDILKRNEPILMRIGTSGPYDQLWGQEVRGQGYMRPNIDLKAWRRHYSRPLWVE